MLSVRFGQGQVVSDESAQRQTSANAQVNNPNQTPTDVGGFCHTELGSAQVSRGLGWTWAPPKSGFGRGGAPPARPSQSGFGCWVGDGTLSGSEVGRGGAPPGLEVGRGGVLPLSHFDRVELKIVVFDFR